MSWGFHLWIFWWLLIFTSSGAGAGGPDPRQKLFGGGHAGADHRCGLRLRLHRAHHQHRGGRLHRAAEGPLRRWSSRYAPEKPILAERWVEEGRGIKDTTRHDVSVSSHTTSKIATVTVFEKPMPRPNLTTSVLHNFLTVTISGQLSDTTCKTACLAFRDRQWNLLDYLLEHTLIFRMPRISAFSFFQTEKMRHQRIPSFPRFKPCWESEERILQFLCCCHRLIP